MRIDSLTFFRFPAALIVVIFHYGERATGFTGFLLAGREVVTFFFVLSGFVLVLAYYNREGVRVASFWWARAARLVPLYLVAVVLFIIVIPGIAAHLDALFLALTMMQSWIPSYATKLNDPAWAISVEVFFYFTFPFILFFLRKARPAPARFIVFALALWLVTQVVLAYLLNSGFYTGIHTPSFYFINCFPLAHFCSFLLGVGGAYWFMNKKARAISRPASLAVLLLAVVLLVAAINNEGAIAGVLGFTPAFGSSFFAPLFLLVVIAIALANDILKGLLTLKPFLILGEASYAVYILQLPLFFLYKKYLWPHIGLTSDNDFYIYLIFLLIVSIVALYVIERPVGRFLRYRLPGLIRGER